MDFLRFLFGKKDKTPPPEEEKETQDQDRRKYLRTQIDVGTFLCFPGGKQIKARILDISPGGVKLVVQMSLNIGSRYELALHSGETVTKVVIITKWERYEQGDYVYGAEFFTIDNAQRAIITQIIQTSDR